MMDRDGMRVKTNPAEHDQLLVPGRAAARMLGIGMTKLRELTRAGVIPSVLIGRSRRYPVADLQSWIERGCPQSEQGGAA